MVTVATEKIPHLMSTNMVQPYRRHLNLIPPRRWGIGRISLASQLWKPAVGKRDQGREGQAPEDRLEVKRRRGSSRRSPLTRQSSEGGRVPTGRTCSHSGFHVLEGRNSPSELKHVTDPLLTHRRWRLLCASAPAEWRLLLLGDTQPLQSTRRPKKQEP